MNIVREKMKALIEKVPFVSDAVKSFVQTFLIGLAAVVASIALLWVTGVYKKLEAALDLKHNSPIVMVPLWVMIAGFAICVFVGLLMFFHKYKRSKSSTVFGDAIAPAFNQNNSKNG